MPTLKGPGAESYARNTGNTFRSDTERIDAGAAACCLHAIPDTERVDAGGAAGSLHAIPDATEAIASQSLVNSLADLNQVLLRSVSI
mmetsp:Transcript_41371/g.97174  ORF Transcript_41371/g.97174 Transcript_41371/m.97174 type:complete len:87 (+) Transcript_41371:99-359(+)